MRLIDADKITYHEVKATQPSPFLLITTKANIDAAPTIEAIPIGVYEQVKGERDVAIEQLKSLNIELFEKPYLEAIPIEWVEKWVEKYNKDLDPWFQGRTAVDDMLDDWEKENETN